MQRLIVQKFSLLLQIRSVQLLCILMLVSLPTACQSSSPGSVNTPTLQTQAAGTSWPEFLSAVENEARKVIEDPVLLSIVSQDTELTIQCPKTFEFVFVNSSGTAVKLKTTDTVPPAVSHAEQFTSALVTSAEYVDQLRSIGARIKLGPEEVCRSVLPEAEGYVKGPELKLYLDVELESSEKGSTDDFVPLWSAWYIQGPGGIKMLWVSSQTGEVVRREFTSESVIPTSGSK